MDPQALILLGKIANRLDELNGTTAGPIVYSMGVANSIPKYNTATSLTPSNIVDDGLTVTITTPVIASSFRIPGGLPTQFLKANGSVDSTVYQPLLINPITGTGTPNRVPKFTSPTSIGNSNITDTGSLVLTSTDMTINGMRVGRGGGNNVYNNVVGAGAFIVNTTGELNTAIGYQTLASNTTGSYNTAVGSFSLFLNETGNYNTAIGSNSLENLITGSNNIGIGYLSGFYIDVGGSPLSQADDSIFIGYNSRAFSDGQTNQIVIGSNTIGLGSNSTVIGNSSTTVARIYGALTADTIAKVNGLGTQFLMANGSVTTAVPNTVTGTGTLNYLPKWSSPTGLIDSIIYDNGSSINIGTTTPIGTKLTIVDNHNTPGVAIFGVKNTTATSLAAFTLQNSGGGTIYVSATGSGYSVPNIGGVSISGSLTSLLFTTNGDVATGGSATIKFRAGGFSTADTMTIIAGNPGRVLIGTNTDNGLDRLQVNGSLIATALKTTGGTASQVVLGTGALGTYGFVGTGTTNYIPKYTSANGIGNSRMIDINSNIGIDTINPLADLEFGMQKDRTVAIHQSDFQTAGYSLSLSGGRTINFIENTNFNSIQFSGGSRYMCTATNGDIYLVAYNGTVYCKVLGSPSWVVISGVSGANAITCDPNTGTIYALSGNTVTKRVNGVGNFVAHSTTPLPFNISSAFVCDTQGTLWTGWLAGGGSPGPCYKQVGATGSWIDTGNAAGKYNMLMADPNGDVFYIEQSTGNLFKKPLGSDLFTSTGTAVGNAAYACDGWIHSDGTMYVAVPAGQGNGIYRRVGRTGAFTLYATITGSTLLGITVDLLGNIYAGTQTDVWFQIVNASGFPNLNGGTLQLKAGTGKGTGQSRVQIITGAKTTSGTNMQIERVVATFNEDGNSIFTGNISAANIVNNTNADGTGIKLSTTDSLNLLINHIARSSTAIGFIDTSDSFRLTKFDDNTLAVGASQFGIIFPQFYKTVAPYSPINAVRFLTARNIPLSAIGLTGTGTAVKYVGWRAEDDSIIFSDVSFIQSPTVAQLGIVLVKYSGGVTSFIDADRTTLTIPDVAAYSNLESTSIGVKASMSIAAIPGTLSHSNSSGSLIGVSVAWGTSNNDALFIPASSTTSFTRLHPGNALTNIPPPVLTVMEPTQYWNGTALTPISGSPNQATVQRLLLTVRGTFVWQYGEKIHSNLVSAQNNILQETYTSILPEGTYAEVGRMAITVGCVDIASAAAQYYPTGTSGGGSSSSSVAWGAIQGNIDDQIDLKARLDAKVGGSGLASYLPRFNGTNTVTNSDVYNAGSGLVGIGTTNPRNVGGYSNLTLENTTGGSIHFRNSALLDIGGIYGAATEVQVRSLQPTIPVTFAINNIEKMRVHTDGNVGIGITSPDSLLHIRNTTGNAQIKINTLLSTGNAVLNFQNNGVGNFLLVYDTSDVLQFRHNLAERARFGATGNFLIATTSDNAFDKLQVNGTISASAATTGNQVVIKSQLDAAIPNITSGIFTPASVATIVYTESTYTKIGNILTCVVNFEATSSGAGYNASTNITLPNSYTVKTTNGGGRPVGSGVASFAQNGGIVYANARTHATSSQISLALFSTSSAAVTYTGSITFAVEVN